MGFSLYNIIYNIIYSYTVYGVEGGPEGEGGWSTQKKQAQFQVNFQVKCNPKSAHTHISFIVRNISLE